jgi:hypothetical protein
MGDLRGRSDKGTVASLMAWSPCCLPSACFCLHVGKARPPTPLCPLGRETHDFPVLGPLANLLWAYRWTVPWVASWPNSSV